MLVEVILDRETGEVKSETCIDAKSEPDISRLVDFYVRKLDEMIKASNEKHVRKEVCTNE